MLKPVRRVVTGHDAQGRSTVLHDGPAKMLVENPHWPGRGQTRLWITDALPASNVGTEDPAGRATRLEPPPGGTHFLITQVMPESDLSNLSAEDRENVHKALFAAVGTERTPGAATPAMHRTASIDYVTVLTGEVTLMLDDGEVTLRPFDTVVQRGTSHAWVNRGSSPALLAVVLVDAEPLAR